MIVYFADRTLDIVGTASTTLPEGLRIVSDEKKEDVDSGIKTFNCSIAYDDKSRKAVADAMKVGNFLLRSHNDENEFYTIIESENNTEAREVSVYAEDAGLDLINTVVDAYSAESTMTIAQYLDLWLPDGWEIGLNESADSLKLEWTSEQTLTERLKELASAFGCELNYSYEIDRLTISARYINVYKKRGQQNATEQLMLGRDVDSVVVRSSVANLATAYNVTGGTPEGKKNPINLNGCDYSSDGETFHSPSVATDDYQIIGKKVVCMSAKTKWASALDEDGLLVRNFSFDTTDKPTLFMQAVKSLMEVKDGEVNYDINLVSLPEGVRLGDRINIVDDKDELYLEGRILELTTSVIGESVKATFGEYLIKDSGISEQLQELARKIARESAVSASTISIASTNGLTFKNQNINTQIVATIYYAGNVIDSVSELEEIYGSNAVIKWYNGSVQIGSGFSVSINSVLPTVTIVCKLIVDDSIASSEVTLQRVDDGTDGQDGEAGAQGYGLVATVQRDNFTEAEWTLYGTVGHEEGWTNTEPCRAGDTFQVTGTATDSGNAHVLYYRQYPNMTRLEGVCIGHNIAYRGIPGTNGTNGTNGISVTQNIKVYYLATSKPSKPSSEVTSTSTSANVWTKSIPNYIANYTYYVCQQTKFSNGTVSWTDVSIESELNTIASDVNGLAVFKNHATSGDQTVISGGAINISNAIYTGSHSTVDSNADGAFLGTTGISYADSNYRVAIKPPSSGGNCLEVKYWDFDWQLWRTYFGVGRTGKVYIDTGGLEIGGTGGSLSVAGTVFISGYEMVDFVKSKGTSGNWTYRKWYSGKIEAWYNGSVNASKTTQANNVHRSTWSATIPNGIFTSTPNIMVANGKATTAVISIGGEATSTTAISGTCFRTTSETSTYAIYLRIYAWT